MSKIEGIRIKNFRGLKDIGLGIYPFSMNSEPLTAMTVVIGKNGVGKSTLFDVFGFLSDALKFGLEEACDLRGRGGFDKIRSKGQTGEIELTIAFRKDENSHPLIYKTAFDLDQSGRPFVSWESIFQLTTFTYANIFLLLTNGVGFSIDENKVINSDNENQINAKSELILKILDDAKIKANVNNSDQELHTLLINLAKEHKLEGAKAIALTDNRKLGIATLGALKQHPEISALREFIEGWYLSYFTPDAARSLPMSGAQQHLNSKGDNLANVVQFMEREHRDSFQNILDSIAGKIPGIDKIATERTSDGRLLLRFNDKGFIDPFYASQMSDGTLKVFAYLLLLADPTPPPLICIEEPENGLYHKLLEILANEFCAHATGRQDGAQLFITTHQPYFVDALDPSEVWILEKGPDGFSTIRRASDDELVKNMVAEGLPLGGLWYSDYLDAR